MVPDEAAQRSAAVPPAVTRVRSPQAAEAAAIFIPPFVGGRTMPAAIAQPDSQPPAAAGESPQDGAYDATAAAQASADAWAPEEELADTAASGGSGFPLDAFIIPEESERLPTGYATEHDQAERVAELLEQLARQVRTRGIAALGTAPGNDELARLIAAAIVQHVARAD